MNAMSELSRSQVLLENAKRECAMLRESEARITAERDVLKQDKQNHAYLLSNIESIKTSIERSESEWKMKIEQKWNAADQECSALRRRLQVKMIDNKLMYGKTNSNCYLYHTI